MKPLGVGGGPFVVLKCFAKISGNIPIQEATELPSNRNPFIAYSKSSVHASNARCEREVEARGILIAR